MPAARGSTSGHTPPRSRPRNRHFRFTGCSATDLGVGLFTPQKSKDAGRLPRSSHRNGKPETPLPAMMLPLRNASSSIGCAFMCATAPPRLNARQMPSESDARHRSPRPTTGPRSASQASPALRPATNASHERQAQMIEILASQTNLSNLAWLQPPILNPTTHVVAVIEPATGRLTVQGWEPTGAATDALTLAA